MRKYISYKFDDYAGVVYGYFTVISDEGRDKFGNPVVKVRCRCGVEKKVSFYDLKNGATKSCGCKSKYHFLDGFKRLVCGIYKMTNPVGDIYIGQSRNIRVRWRGYTQIIKNTKRNKVKDSILKYGLNNHSFSIIHQLPDDVSDEVLFGYEELYIGLYRGCGAPLLNIREGGLSNKHTQESKDKMKGINGKWMLGRKMPNEVIEKSVATRKRNNKPLSEESRERYRQSQLGGNNTMAKLTENDVLKIVELRRSSKIKYAELASMFGVSMSTISNIFNRGWGNVGV